MNNETPADELPEPQPGALGGNVHALPLAPARPLARALEALRPDPADEAERRVLARLKPLHDALVDRTEQHSAQMIECERRLRALEALGEK